MHDDSDVKIFTGGHGDSDTGDLIALAEEMKRHMLNGNSPKAKALGARLADFSPESPELSDELKALMADRSITLDIKVQLKVLMLFASEHTLFSVLSPMVAATASDAMYDKLRREAEGFYLNVSSGAEFTFYYLAVKKNSGVVNAIGDSFSMLCDAENNAGVKELGMKTFELACKQVRKMIDECGFVK